jgi:hypothetical protein
MTQVRRGYVALACAGFAAMLLASCLALRTPEVGEPIALAVDEALVIGQVRVFEQGRELHPWKLEGVELLLADPELKLSLFQVESGRKHPYVPLESDGRFEWIVPAGTYLIYHTPSVDPPFNEPLTAFQVRAGAEPVDLGELRLDITVERSRLGECSGYDVVSVDAAPREPDAALAQLSRHPGTHSIRPGTLVVDPALRGLFANWSREACAQVLASHGIELTAP